MGKVPDDLKTCALCEHCDLHLGTQGWSEWTPGSEGEVDCLKKHPQLDDKSRDEVLVQLRACGSQCDDFELMKEKG